MSHYVTFWNSTLKEGRLEIAHNLGKVEKVLIWNSGGEEREIISPDSLSIAEGKITVDLTSFQPLDGSWIAEIQLEAAEVSE
jgi:hypothetical protein